MIRDAKKSDVKKICDIYNYYVANTIVTFEEEPVSVEEIGLRIEEVQKDFPWLVFEDDGNIVGYAYASKWKSRCAYRFSVESTVYVSEKYLGRKIGDCLYAELISKLQKLDIHSVLGGIALPNVASIKLHEKYGFEKIAQFKEVGWKFNKWIDVGYWELLFPEKSAEQSLPGDNGPVRLRGRHRRL